jgi:hypothetical protein
MISLIALAVALQGAPCMAPPIAPRKAHHHKALPFAPLPIPQCETVIMPAPADDIEPIPTPGVYSYYVWAEPTPDMAAVEAAYAPTFVAGGGAYIVQGSAGTRGANGASGTPGVNGRSGTNGTNGANGASGTPGANGTNGAPGANGAPGPAGPTGPIGPQGPSAPPVAHHHHEAPEIDTGSGISALMLLLGLLAVLSGRRK